MAKAVSRQALRAWVCAALALICAMACLALAVHHPLSVPGAIVACALVAAAAFATPVSWPLWLLPCVPVAGLATWTGWLTFEELDLLVLAAAAGAYGRWAIVLRFEPASRYPAAMGLRAGLVWLGLGVSVLISARLGLADAGGLVWGWWQGFHEPMNSLRLAKAWPLAMLLLPLWVLATHRDAQGASRRLAQGMAGMLGVVGVLVLWERLAFTGLLDFSSDYRATALFWEMHVGGAALDACLALTLPFACQAMLQARSRSGWLLAALCLALGLYACVTTFSRIVFIAIPLGLGVFAAITIANRRGVAGQSDQAMAGWLPGLLLLALFTGLAWVQFSGGGYRGALALALAFALMMPLAGVLRRASVAQLAWAAVFGTLLVSANALLTVLFYKGAYVALALSVLVTVAMLLRARGVPRGQAVAPGLTSVLAVAAHLALVASGPMVAWHWGGERALPTGLLAAGVLALLLLPVRLWPRMPWPESLRWQAGMVGLLLGAVFLVGAFQGGVYLSERFAASQSDSSTRVDHWRKALGLLETDVDWWLGKGLGRYVVQQFNSGRTEDQTGDYRLQQFGGRQWLVLTGGKHLLGWGEMLRVSQRVAPPNGAPTVTMVARSREPVGVLFEVCERQLLYSGACMTGTADMKTGGEAWQTVKLQLVGDLPSRGQWYAPRLISFSVAVASSGGRVEIERLALRSADGSDLLSNGDFSDGMSRWFFSSDKYHLPWHAKNLWVHVLFEQGLLGAVTLLLAMLGALWRLTLGGARRSPLAAPLAAALVGVAVVGVVDSLLDMPRIAWLLYLLLAVALAEQAGPARSLGRRINATADSKG